MLGILWERRLVIVVALVLAAAVSAGLALSSSGVYQSQASVLIPSADPLQSNVTKVSSIASQLQSYANAQLPLEVRQALGSEGSGLISVHAAAQRDLDTYVVTATAKSRAVTQDAASAAVDRLIAKSDSLGRAQVASLRARIQAALKPLNEDRAPLEGLRLAQVSEIKVLKTQWKDSLGTGNASTAANRLRQAQASLDHTVTALSVINNQREGYMNLLRDASDAQLSREAVSAILSQPSNPSSDLAARLVQTVGLGCIVGLTIAALMIMWLERRRFTPGFQSRPSHLHSGSSGAPADRVAASSSAPSAQRWAGQPASERVTE